MRQWIDSYEEAVTNHYSQELRARISAIKVNGLHSELRLGGSVSATPKSKVSLLPSGLKVITNHQTVICIPYSTILMHNLNYLIHYCNFLKT